MFIKRESFISAELTEFSFSPFVLSVYQDRDASSNTHMLSQNLLALAKMEQFKNKLVSPSMTHTHPRCVSTF